MNSKKNLIISSIAIIGLLVVGGISYKYLSNRYLEKESTYSETSDESKETELNNIYNSKNNTNETITFRDFKVYNKKGEAIKLSDYKGKKGVVVNFWASWCPPCKAEMPYFNEATKKYKDKDVEILMVNITDGMRETEAKALDYIESKGYNMNVMFDKDLSAASAYEVEALPRTIFIDKEGNIINNYTGLISEEILDNNIKNIIEQ
ncbi:MULTISPECIES: TlpA family protein disulfide reductase [Clostridium]|uniref:TlpA disulfide reductase family protein n=1 Tax=Clostridium nitritogenes TaxID=83340 RepID=A0ABN1LPD3_9CLOT|nr:TlpA disulfide reductase family protein [Clostridium baratii]MBT9831611.1 redoxin domain-containing protein [Clostridium baratii]MDU1854474.1 TlpA disulfide reductase family protein [Clostridium baratii]MDY3208063.1 TlpA disulfide reductase family protein [Clostridium baratii]